MKPKASKLDESFKGIMWSYDFDQLDLNRDKQSIIINTINYGNLDQWRWINDYYGLTLLKQTIMSVPTTAIRSRVKPLVKLIWSITDFNRHPAKRRFASDVDTKKVGTVRCTSSVSKDKGNFRRNSNNEIRSIKK